MEFSHINRIVPRSYYNQDLSWALRNEVRDPLWTLLRQHELGEFDAFDGGALVKAVVEYTAAHPHELFSDATGTSASFAFDVNQPIESQVQHQTYWSFDISAIAEFNSRLSLIFRRHGVSLASQTKQKLIEDFPLLHGELDDTIDSVTEESALLHSRKSLKQKYDKWKNKLFDVRKFFTLYPDKADAVNFALWVIDQQDGSIPEYVPIFHDFYDYAKSAGLVGFTQAFWNERELSYQFGLNVQHGSSEQKVPLRAPDYTFGDVDWFHLDGSDKNVKDYFGDFGSTFSEYKRVFIPSTFNFSGKPANRWWQFEDSDVAFDGIQPNSSADTSVLAIHQFSLLFSNDWFIIPLSVPFDSLMSIKSVIVEDHFGNRYSIRPHDAESEGNTSETMPWGVFNPSTSLDDAEKLKAMYVAGSKAFRIESEPLEEVSFLKDEVGNLYYAVETKVPDGMGGGMDGNELSLAMHDFFSTHLPVIPPLNPTESRNPKYDFRLANPAPENWIPFVADNNNSMDVFRRAKFPRYIDGRYNPGTQFIRPKTSLLNTSFGLVPSQPMIVNRTRISNFGTTIGLKWNRMRWRNGKVVYWLSKYNKLGYQPDLSFAQQFDSLTRTSIAPSIAASNGPRFEVEWVPGRVAHFSSLHWKNKNIVIANNEALAIWPAQSSKFNEFTVAGLPIEVTYKQAGIGVNPSIALAQGQALVTSGNYACKDFTIFLVFRADYKQGASKIFTLREGSGGASDFVFGFGLNQQSSDSSFGVQLPDSPILESYSSMNSGSSLITLSVSGFAPNAPLAGRVDFRLNGYSTGELIAISAGATHLPSVLPKYDTLMVGSVQEGFDGLVSEILVYNRKLTAREVNDIESILKDRYSL